MDLTTFVDILEPHIIRMIQSNKIALNSSSGSGGEEARMFVANAAFATEFNIASVASGSNRDATVNIDATPSGSGVGQINLSVPSAGGTINLTATQRITLNGTTHVTGALNAGSNTVIVTNDGTLSVGNLSADYTPIDSTWNTNGSTLLLNASTYSTIGFHDSGARVDYIRAGAGVITIGYNGGYGAARVDFGGVVGTGWDGLSFGSGWANYGGAYQTGQVKKVGDVVFLRGLVYRFTGSGTTIATLPAGYRPPARCLVGVHTNTGLGRIDILTDGTISAIGGGTDWIQLDTVLFSVA